MAHIYPARTADTSLSTGSGAIVVSGVTPDESLRTFNQVMQFGDTVYLGVAHRDESEWEEGRYTYVGTNRFVRTEIFQSSNNGAPVDFSAGIKDVFATVPSRTVELADLAVTQINTTTVDFGDWPGMPDTSLDVSAPNVTDDSVVLVHILAKDTDDHSADEHWIDPPTVIAGNIVEGVGFTIYATGEDLYGEYTIAYAVK